MSPASPTLASSRLKRLVQGSANVTVAAEPEEHCELCNAPIPSQHRHLLELSTRELMCACRPCSLLFDRGGAGNGRYKLVPERRLRLEDFAMSDLAWEELRIPVDMAFLFHSSAEGKVVAYYPGPMGPTESQLEFELVAGARAVQSDPGGDGAGRGGAARQPHWRSAPALARAARRVLFARRGHQSALEGPDRRQRGLAGDRPLLRGTRSSRAQRDGKEMTHG